MSVSKGAPFKGAKPSEREGRHDPKFIGEIPGYPVGSRFKNRDDLSGAGVHAPLRAGIHGNKVDGAYSVVLSYGYEDDEDHGETFTYTGQGGRDTNSSKLDKMQGKESWSSHQASDQQWKFGNKALQISHVTGKPVRVIRGAPRKNSELFKYAPSEGLRYDGLYRVTDAWKDEGVTGFKTCKFIFERLPNQLPLPGGHTLSSNTAGSSRKSLQSSRTSKSSSSSKFVKPPRIPHVPRPPYRPSEADIAKLRSNGKSKCISPSVTPEYIGAKARTSQSPQNISQSQLKGVHNPGPPYQSSETDAVRLKSESHCTSPDYPRWDASYLEEAHTPIKAESASPEPASPESGSDSYPSPSPTPSFLELKQPSRKRLRDVSDDSFGESSLWPRNNMYVESDEESLNDDMPWATVRGKQKIPSSLNFKRRKV